MIFLFVFRRTFVHFVLFACVRTSERCYRNMFGIFFCHLFAIRWIGHWLTPQNRCGTVWYQAHGKLSHQRSVNTAVNTNGKRHSVAKGFVRDLTGEKWNEQRKKIEIIQETNTVFKDHLLITTAYLSQSPSFIILIGRSKRLSTTTATAMCSDRKWLRASGKSKTAAVSITVKFYWMGASNAPRGQCGRMLRELTYGGRERESEKKANWNER